MIAIELESKHFLFLPWNIATLFLFDISDTMVAILNKNVENKNVKTKNDETKNIEKQKHRIPKMSNST